MAQAPSTRFRPGSAPRHRLRAAQATAASGSPGGELLGFDRYAAMEARYSWASETAMAATAARYAGRKKTAMAGTAAGHRRAQENGDGGLWPPSAGSLVFEASAFNVCAGSAVTFRALAPAVLEAIEEAGLAGLTGAASCCAAHGVQVGGLALATGLHREGG
jgi:hypothetical protein